MIVSAKMRRLKEEIRRGEKWPITLAAYMRGTDHFRECEECNHTTWTDELPHNCNCLCHVRVTE